MEGVAAVEDQARHGDVMGRAWPWYKGDVSGVFFAVFGEIKSTPGESANSSDRSACAQWLLYVPELGTTFGLARPAPQAFTDYGAANFLIQAFERAVSRGNPKLLYLAPTYRRGRVRRNGFWTPPMV